MKSLVVREIEHTWIPLRDGVRLSARLWLPVTPGGIAVPAILEYIPYRKRDMVRARDERNHPYFSRRGYACVRVDMRGSGDSGGLMTDMYAPEELDDAIEVVDWIARQPWCSGAVGMMGTSWGGTASLQAAARRPAALKAVIAVCATDNRYDDDIHHMGGCLLTDSVEWGATLPAILASPPDPDTVGPGWREMWMARLEDLRFPLENWVRHETRDHYWRWGAVSERPGAIACPVLAIGGWSDRYSNTVMNLVAQNPDRCWGIVGPWGHHYPDVGAPGPGMGFQQEALRWWDRWLRGVDNGVDRAPRLRVWLQDYCEPQDRLTRRPGRWIGEPRWPCDHIQLTALYPSAGRLRFEPGPEHEIAMLPTDLGVGRAAGDTGYFGREGGLPLDQRVDDERSLVFESEPLDRSVTVLGRARFSVRLDADRPVAMLAARLNDVPPSGGVARVGCAILNLALDDSGAGGRRWTPGEFERHALDFPNAAYHFAKGHRIRLALSGSYWPLIWPSPSRASIRLRCGDARLTLPVRPDTGSGAAVDLAEPIAQINPDVEVVAARGIERWAGYRNHVLCAGWHQPLRCVRMRSIGLEFGFETRARHSIDPNDPLSARSVYEHRLRYRRDGWCVDVAGFAELTATNETFELRGSIEVKENGQSIFRRDWRPSVPRRCS